MSKILWIGDSPAVTTGFGRVAQGVLENLNWYGDYQISVLGVNHPMGDPHQYEGMFRIYPARAKNNVYGFNRVGEVIEKEKPDIIIVNNDLWVLNEYLKGIPPENKVIVYFPIDALPVQQAWVDTIKKVNVRIATYTNYARNGMLSVDSSLDISIIGHGVDLDEFYPIEDARDLVSVPKESFVIQNINRNQPRKRLDLFIQAVSIFINRKSVREREFINLYYHGALKDMGWNIVDLAARYGVQDRLLVTSQEGFTPSTGVPLNMLCKIYNTADIHVLTSMGEGFGLSPFESGACGVAQIVPNHSACKELWGDIAPLIKIHHVDVLTGGINTEGSVIDVEHLADIIDDLYQNRDKLKKLREDVYKYVQQEQFTWEFIGKQFHNLIEEVLSDDSMLSIKYDGEPKQEVEVLEKDESAISQ